MTARPLDGRPIAARLRESLAARCAALLTATGRPPGLGIVEFDKGGPSAVYADSVVRAARRVGIEPVRIEAGPEASLAELSGQIGALNGNPQVAGIVVAEPVPSSLGEWAVVDLIDPAKDVDGATSVNAGRLMRGEPTLVPATALAVMEMLRTYDVPVSGRRVVVVGRSMVIGRPVAALLLAADATVVICHRQTSDLAAETRRAEILVVAAGAPGLITPDMVSPECVVVDCGITTVGDRVVGDVAPEVTEVARAVSPVPGGVGPVTSMMLASQTLDVAERLAPSS